MYPFHIHCSVGQTTRNLPRTVEDSSFLQVLQQAKHLLKHHCPFYGRIMGGAQNGRDLGYLCRSFIILLTLSNRNNCREECQTVSFHLFSNSPQVATTPMPHARQLYSTCTTCTYRTGCMQAVICVPVLTCRWNGLYTGWKSQPMPVCTCSNCPVCTRGLGTGWYGDVYGSVYDRTLLTGCMDLWIFRCV